MNTVPKYLGSPSLYAGSENMRRHSKVTFEGCAWVVQDLLPWMWATWLSHSHSLLQFTTAEDPPMPCWLPQPQNPGQYPCPTPPAETWHPLHSLPTYTKSPLKRQWDQASRFLLRTCQMPNFRWFQLKIRNLTRFSWKRAQFHSKCVTDFNKHSLGFDFLVKLETTCVLHGLGFCCEFLTQLYGNSLFLWAFSISYPSQNHKKQRLENMKTSIMWKKGGLNFLNLRQRLCSFRVQSEVLN